MNLKLWMEEYGKFKNFTIFGGESTGISKEKKKNWLVALNFGWDSTGSTYAIFHISGINKYYIDLDERVQELI